MSIRERTSKEMIYVDSRNMIMGLRAPRQGRKEAECCGLTAVTHDSAMEELTESTEVT